MGLKLITGYSFCVSGSGSRHCLARAVGADVPEALAFLDVEVEVVQRDELSVALGQVYRLYDHTGNLLDNG